MEATRNRLAELSAAGLALECSGWLDQLSLQLRQLGGRLLGPCSSGQGLLQVEAAVKAALEEWQYQLQASRCGVVGGCASPCCQADRRVMACLLSLDACWHCSPACLPPGPVFHVPQAGCRSGSRCWGRCGGHVLG